MILRLLLSIVKIVLFERKTKLIIRKHSIDIVLITKALCLGIRVLSSDAWFQSLKFD